MSDPKPLPEWPESLPWPLTGQLRDAYDHGYNSGVASAERAARPDDRHRYGDHGWCVEPHAERLDGLWEGLPVIWVNGEAYVNRTDLRSALAAAGKEPTDG